MSTYKYVRRTFTYDGKRYEVRGKSAREANEKARVLRNELENTGGSRIDRTTTCSELFEEWFTVYKVPSKISERRLKCIRSRYVNQIEPHIGNKSISRIKSTDLQLVVNANSGMCKGYYREILQILHGMFHRAYIDRRIPFDPSDGLIAPDGTAGSHRSITEEEREFILSFNGPLGTLCRIMLYAGLRPGEAIVLQWQDIDFDRNEIHVYKAYNHDDPTVVKGPKSAAGVRDIPMLPELREFLISIRSNPFDHVCCLPNKKLYTPETFGSQFRKAVNGRWPGTDLTLYCLRHTFATDLQKADVPINVAKELLGHSSIEMTANIYTHKDQSNLHRNMEKMSGVGKNVVKINTR
mgnify:CR=1 FL=1